MIKEIIVVEGKADISAVKRAVDAEMIATGGYGFPKGVTERIKKAHQERGIIVLTDPDYAGEKIRKKITAMVGSCKHAFISREEGMKDEDIGVENASPESIRRALEKARYEQVERREEFSYHDLVIHGLTGDEGASDRRAYIGEILGIGYCNAKQFLNRLNHYGISREEFVAALASFDGQTIGGCHG